MRKSAIVIPLLAIAAGVVGFFLRHTELRDIFVDGLPERGAQITFLLIAFSSAIAFLVLIFSVIVGLRCVSPRGYENVFGADIVSYPVFFFVAGLVWLVATIVHFVNVPTTDGFPTAEIYFTVLSALSAVSLAVFAIETYQEPRKRAKLALSLVPSLFMCFWVILLYRRNASNPILLSYAYFCLALLTSTLGFYLTCGFVFNKSAPGKTIFFCLVAIFFCGVTLADDHTLAIRLILVSILAVNFANSMFLIRNLKPRPDF